MKKFYLPLIILSTIIIVGCSSTNAPNAKDEKGNKIITDTTDKCTYDTLDKCDNSCTSSSDCRVLTPKVCININEKNESENAISFYWLPRCKCENKKCVVEE